MCLLLSHQKHPVRERRSAFMPILQLRKLRLIKVKLPMLIKDTAENEGGQT